MTPRRQKARDDKLWKREFTWATQHEVDKMRCPCAKCEGMGRMVLLRTVRNHLILNGRHPLFRVWKGPGPTDHSNEEWVEASRAAVNPMGTKVEVQVVDEAVNVNQLLDDLFQMLEEEHEGERVANLSSDHNVEGMEVTGMVQNAIKIMEELAALPKSMPNQNNHDRGQGGVDNDMGLGETGAPSVASDDDISTEANYLREACQPLYNGARCTKLASTLLLMNVCTVHGVSNKFMDELLALLHKHLLPKDNLLPPSMYAAKRLTRKVGLDYKHIHACVNGCILFRKQYSTLEACSKCGATWYKKFGTSLVPQKVLRHFPLIPRLLRMY